MRILIILFLFYFSCSSISPGIVYNNKTYGNVIVDSIISISRGDRFRGNIKDLPPIIGENITNKTFKVKNIVIEAKEYTENALRNSKIIELRNMQRGKLNFVIVADVFVDGQNLAKKLIRARLGKEYYKGKVPVWP